MLQIELLHGGARGKKNSLIFVCRTISGEINRKRIFLIVTAFNLFSLTPPFEFSSAFRQKLESFVTLKKYQVVSCINHAVCRSVIH